ncbi:DNA (cytosine-5-)-methyltransferase [Mammaliicoccus fleurettii]|uniref:DNA (cytosine-5-)-methyltransferase n=1 Tax=Mammaliicoccus fleurettii TaxID=150056 RepID=UPI002DBA99D0|nr:DNA (cytosine-5-)-methyltransferase [Mammaliicoccus fleurettii]MEB8068154.1 DNA (cytosine-5-)-methyltransferase [Mammaliicoccus fleurettii]
MLKIIEAFSGIGSQVQALKNINVEHKVEAIMEWEIGAMYAYDIMHNGKQDLSQYRHHTRESLIKYLSKHKLSNDGKEPLSDRSLNAMNVSQLKAILVSIERNNNLVDISSAKAEQLPNADLLTYSFPCQDLSQSGYWHKNTGGIDRDANNRSTLLWQVERLLKEYIEIGKELPTFLLMENVNNILSNQHIKNFTEWQNFLEDLGYVNKVYTLDARNFGIPQSRVRTYMISVLAIDKFKKNNVIEFFEKNNLEDIQINKSNINTLGNYLKLDYTNRTYKKEAIESTPIFTSSREKIYENNVVLAKDDKPLENKWARTITTKQDRHPNSGIIVYDKCVLTPINKKYRNLTPRECFLLMGFKEEQFESLLENNLPIGKDRKILPSSKLIKLAGNSIVVPVLEKIFEQIDEINNEILKKEQMTLA